jgi:hypothetical protein
VTKDEYQRVVHLIARRPPSASMALREMVEANLLDPTEAKREPAKRERYCTQGCDD